MTDDQVQSIPVVRVGDQPSEFERVFGPGPMRNSFRGQPEDEELAMVIINRVSSHDVMTAVEKDSIDSFIAGMTVAFPHGNLGTRLHERIMMSVKTALISGYLVGRRDGVTLGEIPPFPEDDIHE